jgi:hypothetical protein
MADLQGWDGDSVAIGLLVISPSSTNQLQKRKSRRYRTFAVPGSWDSLSTASHSRMAARFNSLSVAVRPLISSQREKESHGLAVEPQSGDAAPFGAEVTGKRAL